MKKKITAVVLGIWIVTSLAGCAKKSLSNEYITITEYQGLEVAEAEPAEITEAMVDSEIEYILSADAVVEEVSGRAARDGDLVRLDYSPVIEGEKFDGSSAAGVLLELGADELFIARGNYESFADQVAGHKTGDKFEVTVQLAEDYRDAKAAGKTVKFAVELKAVSASNTSQLSDEWVRSNSKEAETAAEYKEEIKRQLEEQRDESVNTIMRNRILEALLDHVEVKRYPEEQVAGKIKSLTAYYQSLADSNGMPFGEYSEQYLGMTEVEFAAEAEKIAKKAVTTKLACELIADHNRLNLSDDQSEMEQYAIDNGYESLDALLKQIDTEELKSTLLQGKVAEYLIKKSVPMEQTEPSKKEEGAAAVEEDNE